MGLYRLNPDPADRSASAAFGEESWSSSAQYQATILPFFFPAKPPTVV